MNNSWQIIGNLKPQELTESRLQLHYAVQFIAVTGSALAAALPDYSHTSLEWNPALKMFTGALISVQTPFRVALDPIGLTLIVIDRQNNIIAGFPLHQKTMTEGLNWLKEQISKLGANTEEIFFPSYPQDDFPDYAVAHGAAFDASQQLPRQELTNYYANTNQILQEIIATNEETSSIHIWPHHFDIASLILLPGTKNDEPMSIGIGLSPGDKSYNEPYWYVSPYPYPETENLPSLDSNGFWHTQHWVGAVLMASQLAIPKKDDTDIKVAEIQKQQVKTFLNSTLKLSKVLLNTGSITRSK
ncbi:hypothetical protein IQ264_29165 [Phormidium sp. LEGE 05292]|uniref:hypothetical protein n=1 Tax=[Phormidium] sp. LEGE 05292 TaxID=767427 RepID=UPI0018814F9E|nr:hypothetical protein [Phormidium sp. LEGE 05292]MBE9229481.1 hypothetical protein [Phormidium sp. LEGE 05292]